MLAKPEHENRISHICTDNVKTGIANTLGEWVGNHVLPTWDAPLGRWSLRLEQLGIWF